MPSHISHAWHDEVSRGCSVPFLHVGECVARELKKANLRPVETGSPLRIGVLAADATLKTDSNICEIIFLGFEVVLPDKATIEHTVIPAVDAFNRRDMEGAWNLLRIALQVLLLRAMNTVILASDDMRELLPHDDPILKKCVDPLDALARSVSKFYVANGELSCQMYQRSADMGLGVPFNIASYALLTCMIAHVCDLVPGDFVQVIGDAHVYLNHIRPLQEQLKKLPKPFPILKFNPQKKDIDSFVAADFELICYDPHQKIGMNMAV
ncbi:hypothetical protein RHSIM_Rhsim03G0104000 [Rhododendron simsii]|uniref:thymidylate synthase n=1 Tax=Rhododendron simsii TaxID=118357 RepID=A0A834HJW8_RHOSS|nr:hypothetical protein RHSIM_Rhsim03G0104000 [Rhododendron simsii]